MNPLAIYPISITATLLGPVIMWLGDWPLKPPTAALSVDIGTLILALVGSYHAWRGGHLDSSGTPRLDPGILSTAALDQIADRLAEHLRPRTETQLRGSPMGDVRS